MGQLTAYDKFMEQALKYGFSMYGLPKTGQTVKYRTGDDGDYEKGYPVRGDRFVDNGDGTISDRATGLMWVKEPGAIGGNFGSAGNPSTMTWNNAVDECEALTYAGHSDWRLPNAFELLSILNFTRTSPSAYTAYFPDTQISNYHSSTTYSAGASLMHFVRFNYPGLDHASKLNTMYVRPVRLGP